MRRFLALQPVPITALCLVAWAAMWSAAIGGEVFAILPAVELSAAGRERLAAERAAIAAEIEADATRDPGLNQRAAAKVLAAEVASPQALLTAFASAYATLDPRFASGWEHYVAGRAEPAHTAWKPLITEDVSKILIKAKFKHDTLPPYTYCLVRLLIAEVEELGGDVKNAVISHQVVFGKMPASLAMAGLAQLHATRIYLGSGRAHWVLPILRDYAAAFHGCLTPLASITLGNRIRSIEQTQDPYRTAFHLATANLARIRHGGSDRAALVADQDRLLAALNGMLALAEEEPRPFLEHSESLSDVGGDGANLREGKSPADFATLTGATPALAGDDTWGALRPRERQELLQALQQRYPQRYRDLLEAYYRALATQPAAEPGK
ncbi:hypothetical protein LBMAG53_01660 [Planctomycetota bacterium]|nr:hypothetical protein LBMAG53_01660 [Planctomycetota bacterium]